MLSGGSQTVSSTWTDAVSESPSGHVPAYLLSANISLPSAPQQLCTSTMGSSSSTQHHFAFQNAEKGMCSPPSEPALAQAVKGRTPQDGAEAIGLSSSHLLELGCSLAVTSRKLSRPSELRELKCPKQLLLSYSLCRLHSSE